MKRYGLACSLARIGIILEASKHRLRLFEAVLDDPSPGEEAIEEALITQKHMEADFVKLACECLKVKEELKGGLGQ